MAHIYVRSTDGNNADDGSTWALAKATAAGADAIDAESDQINLSSAHSESTAGAVTLAWSGTQANPMRILSVNDAAEPPTALASGATIATTGASNIQTAGNTAYVYVNGVTYTAGDAANNASVRVAGIGTYENCTFYCRGTSSAAAVVFGFSFQNVLYIKTPSIRFSATGHGITTADRTVVKIEGGGLHASSSAVTTLFKSLSSHAQVEWSGGDLSVAAAAVNLFQAGSLTGVRAILRDCKLPASWSGNLTNGTPGPGCRFEMFNCDSGDTNYRYRAATECGTIQDETTLVRTGGASDGTTTYSLKVVTNANADFPTLTLATPEIVRWNDTTGSAITVTVEFLHDSATNMQDDDIWLEVMYLGTSGFPLASFASDAAASVMATAADQTDSSETWTTTGMTNPNTQKLSVTFTPQEKGFIHAVVKVAQASKTVYVDPELTVS